MAEFNRIGFQENLTAYGNDHARQTFVNFGYSNPSSHFQPQSMYNQTVPTYYTPQNLVSVENQSYNSGFEPHIQQVFQAQQPIINKRFIVKEHQNQQIAPNPNRTGSRVGTAVPVTSPKNKSTALPQYVSYKTQLNEAFSSGLVEENKEKKAAAGALEMTIASGASENPRRYKDKDKGQFLCGKCGWIAVALLITILLTLALLFGLGIIGGQVTPSDKIVGNTASFPVVDNSTNQGTEVNEQQNNQSMNQANSKANQKLNKGDSSRADSTQVNGSTNVSPFPSNNKNSSQQESPSSTTKVTPIIPAVSPSNSNNKQTKDTANPSRQSETQASTSTSTSMNNQPSPITSNPTQQQTIKPNTVTPNNQPSPSTAKQTNQINTIINSASTTPSSTNNASKQSEKASPPNNPSSVPSTDNNQKPETTTNQLINPNSVLPKPANATTSQTTPIKASTVPKPIVAAPPQPPAPNYVGPAQYDFYPNYVLAQLAHQLGMIFRH